MNYMNHLEGTKYTGSRDPMVANVSLSNYSLFCAHRPCMFPQSTHLPSLWCALIYHNGGTCEDSNHSRVLRDWLCSKGGGSTHYCPTKREHSKAKTQHEPQTPGSPHLRTLPAAYILTTTCLRVGTGRCRCQPLLDFGEQSGG